MIAYNSVLSQARTLDSEQTASALSVLVHPLPLLSKGRKPLCLTRNLTAKYDVTARRLGEKVSLSLPPFLLEAHQRADASSSRYRTVVLCVACFRTDVLCRWDYVVLTIVELWR